MVTVEIKKIEPMLFSVKVYLNGELVRDRVIVTDLKYEIPERLPDLLKGVLEISEVIK